MSFDPNSRAETARTLVVQTMPEELCLSFPIPMRWRNEGLVTGFFTYGVSMLTRQPYPAEDCRIVLGDGSVVIDDDILVEASSEFDTSRDVPPERWGEHYEQAYQSYDAAFEELEVGAPGTQCDAYATAVRAATVLSLMPYYRVLCPELFA